jgi:hypothetical protein
MASRTPVVFVALPTCNIAELIEPVLEKLLENTTLPFVLSVCDNASTDDTYARVKKMVTGPKAQNSEMVKVYLTRSLTREVSTRCINTALRPANRYLSEVAFIAKLDHDYGVPEYWSEVIEAHFAYPIRDYTLLSPSVRPETPKGMQYYSQGHTPAKIDQLNYLGTLGSEVQPGFVEAMRTAEIYQYEGIAGYCHCFTPQTFTRLGGEYRPLTKDAVFGSEDADWSLRCGPIETKGYIMSLKGWHWDKPDIGVWEEKWKAEATFGRTFQQWEEWARENVPAELHGRANLP